MHILILGGSGRTGQLIITEALSKGHQVTALVRSASSLPPRDNLHIIEGTPLQPLDLDRAFSAAAASTTTTTDVAPISAVIVALNARRTSDSPFSAPSPDTPARLMADSVANTTTAMARHGTRRIVIMSTLGTGDSFASLSWPLRALFRYSGMRFQQRDHDAVDAEIRSVAAASAGGPGGLEFTLVRPAMLVEGEADAVVRVWPDDGKGVGLLSQVSRASVARFLVRAVETREIVGRSPVITN